jgi:hypothetical protein
MHKEMTAKQKFDAELEAALSWVFDGLPEVSKDLKGETAYFLTVVSARYFPVHACSDGDYKQMEKKAKSLALKLVRISEKEPNSEEIKRIYFITDKLITSASSMISLHYQDAVKEMGKEFIGPPRADKSWVETIDGTGSGSPRIG